MNIIRESNENVIKFLGGFQKKMDGIDYHFNNKCIFVDYDDFNKIIFNTITGSIVVIKNVELNNIRFDFPLDYVENLIWNYFLVKDNFNEDEVIEKYRKANYLYRGANFLDTISSFVIMTTTLCNARCPYCYELGFKNKKHMSDEVVDKVCQFIKTKGDIFNPIQIGFFGGEPLYNEKIISKITTLTKAQGFNLSTNMITNGYLFTPEIINKAISEWNMNSVQITLDGVDEDYNNIKKYIYKDDPNPFATVITNIHNLLNAGIEVAVRINCGVNNYEKLEKLVHFLGKEFEGINNFHVYPWEIFQENTPENSEILHDNLTKLFDLINFYNMGIVNQFSHGIKTLHCMVDDGKSVMFTPDGKVGTCEHYVDKFLLTDLDNPHIKNEEALKAWDHYDELNGPMCKDCKLKALCLRMEHCAGSKICDESTHKYLMHKTEVDLIKFVDLNNVNDKNE